MNEAPIFITGLHKSGTTLLRALLDGHPQLQCIPFESHFMALAGSWTENEYQKSNPKAFDRQRFLAFIERNNRVSDKYADNFASGLLDLEVFGQNFQGDLSTKQKQADRYFAALRQSLFGEVKGRLVEKSIENFEYFHEYKALYPKAKFIHLIRNPYDNLVSLRKFKQKSGHFPLMSRLLPAMRQQYYHLYRNREHQDYYVLRYEDLIQDSEGQMRKLASFLELDWQDSLLEPSIMGKAWSGNSIKDKAFTGISKSLDTSWQEEISAYEVQLFNKLLNFVPEDLGYELFEKSGSIWTKAKGESLTRYLFNRGWWWYWRSYREF